MYDVGMVLQEQSYLVLVALLDGPAHGYGVIQQVEQISAGRVRLRAGTLYGALERLADEGLVERDREEVVDGRLRRYYRLTAAGIRTVAEETDRRRSTAGIAARRLRAHAAPGGSVA